MKKSKKDKKKYYKQNTINNKRKDEIAETLTGILITTDKNKEKNCVRDAYNILNDAVEHIYPDLLTKINQNLPPVEDESSKPEKKQKISEDEHVVTKTSNISDLLENELRNLRGGKTKLFYNFETNCKGVVFIKVEKNFRSEIDVKSLVSYIIKNIKNTKEQVSKNIARFIPVEIAMKAKFDIFEKNAPLILDKYFKNTEFDGIKKTWRLEFKHRNNNSIHKDQYLEYLLKYMDRNKFIVDYKNSDFVVLIEITNDLLCLSILEDYQENKFYNLLTLSKSEEELKLEREKLINMQIKREAEKLKEKENESKVESNNEEVKNILIEKSEELNVKNETVENVLKEENLIDNGDDSDIDII